MKRRRTRNKWPFACLLFLFDFFWFGRIGFVFWGFMFVLFRSGVVQPQRGVCATLDHSSCAPARLKCGKKERATRAAKTMWRPRPAHKPTASISHAGLAHSHVGQRGPSARVSCAKAWRPHHHLRRWRHRAWSRGRHWHWPSWCLRFLV